MEENTGDANPESAGLRKTKIMNTIIIIFFIITICLLLYLFSLYNGIKALALSQNCSNPSLNISSQLWEIPPQAPVPQSPLPNQTNYSS